MGGVEATRVRLEAMQEQVGTLWITVFQKQGIVYRIFGGGPNEKTSTLDTEYQALLNSFAFLAERKDWLLSREGKPGGRHSWPAWLRSS